MLFIPFVSFEFLWSFDHVQVATVQQQQQRQQHIVFIMIISGRHFGLAKEMAMETQKQT